MTVSDDEMKIIGLNQVDRDIMNEVTFDFTSTNKDAEAMSVFLQENISGTNPYNTRELNNLTKYKDWIDSARKDPNLLGLIPGNTVPPNTTLYNNYVNDINDAREDF